MLINAPQKIRLPAASATRRYSVHGVPVELADAWDLLDPHLEAWLRPFSISREDSELPGAHGPLPVTGSLKRYEEREVLRHLSTSAVRLANTGRDRNALMELYQDGERFWLVDDRWGMVELNLIKGSWRSWLLPKATLDLGPCTEMVLLWPLAQILRGRGLNLLPSISLRRGDDGILLVANTDVDADVDALTNAGFEVVGRRWSCLREKGATVELLPFPDPASSLVSLNQTTRCQAVVLIESARRPVANLTELSNPVALDGLRRAWPAVELQRNRRQLAMRLATGCRVASVQLSRDPNGLLQLLEKMQSTAAVRDRPPTAQTLTRRFVPATVRA